MDDRLGARRSLGGGSDQAAETGLGIADHVEAVDVRRAGVADVEGRGSPVGRRGGDAERFGERRGRGRVFVADESGVAFDPLAVVEFDGEEAPVDRVEASDRLGVKRFERSTLPPASAISNSLPGVALRVVDVTVSLR